MESLKVLNEESFEYEGPLALCDGNGDGNGEGDGASPGTESSSGFSGAESQAQSDAASAAAGTEGDTGFSGAESQAQADAAAAAEAAEAEAAAQAAARQTMALGKIGFNPTMLAEALGMPPADAPDAPSSVGTMHFSGPPTTSQAISNALAALGFGPKAVGPAPSNKMLGFNPASYAAMGVPAPTTADRAAEAAAEAVGQFSQFGKGMFGKYAVGRGVKGLFSALAADKLGAPAAIAAKVGALTAVTPSPAMFVQGLKAVVGNYNTKAEASQAVAAARAAAEAETGFFGEKSSDVSSQISAHLADMGINMSPESIGRIGIGINPSPSEGTPAEGSEPTPGKLGQNLGTGLTRASSSPTATWQYNPQPLKDYLQGYYQARRMPYQPKGLMGGGLYGGRADGVFGFRY